ncbi:MAG: CBS domain-containing protein [Planctomycetota bacterium]|jgi:predicted transcriptional regulator
MNVSKLEKSSTAVGTLFASAIAKVRAEAEEAIAEQKAKSEAEAAEAIAQINTQAEEKTKAYADTITRLKAQAKEQITKVKSQAEEKAAEFTETIARLKAQIEEKAKTYTDSIGQTKSSTRVGRILLDAVAKQKAKSEAEAAEAIVRVKAEAEEKITEYADMIAKVRAEAEQKATEYADTIAKVRAEAEQAIAEEKAKSQAETAEAIARVKAEAEEKITGYADTIAKVRTEAEEKAAKLKAKSESRAEHEMARVRTQDEEEAKSYADTITKVKTETKDIIAKIKTRAAEAIEEVKTEAKDAITKVKAEIEDAIAEQKTSSYPDRIVENEAEGNLAIINKSREHDVGSVSGTIQRKTQPPQTQSGEHTFTALGDAFRHLLRDGISRLCAKDIMQKQLVWASPDDSVQQIFTKMQQYNTGYVMVGVNGILEGIVSKSDITGAISPYLRPVFAKWRRPMDDATLQIRIKWIMNRPAQTINLQTPLEAIMKNMCRFRMPCLPVIGRQGEVKGLVAEVNILKAILKIESNAIFISSETPHRQPISVHPLQNISIPSTKTAEIPVSASATV